MSAGLRSGRTLDSDPEACPPQSEAWKRHRRQRAFCTAMAIGSNPLSSIDVISYATG
jgi:hypothetical protein